MYRFAAAVLMAVLVLQTGVCQDLGANAGRTLQPPDLSHCATLEACLALIDAAASGRLDVDSEVAAEARERVGEPAKQALLDRAVSPRQELRDEVADILSHWSRWSRADVPKLAAGLRHRGWPASPLGDFATLLGDIGGPEAIDALVGRP